MEEYSHCKVGVVSEVEQTSSQGLCLPLVWKGGRLRGLALGAGLPAQGEAEYADCWICLPLLRAKGWRGRRALDSAVPKVEAVAEEAEAVAEEAEGDALTQQGGMGEGVK